MATGIATIIDQPTNAARKDASIVDKLKPSSFAAVENRLDAMGALL